MWLFALLKKKKIISNKPINNRGTHAIVTLRFFGALELRFEDPNQILIGLMFRGGFSRESQKWNKASASELAAEVALLDCEDCRDCAMDGSRRSDGADCEWNYGRGRSAKNGVQSHRLYAKNNWNCKNGFGSRVLGFWKRVLGIKAWYISGSILLNDMSFFLAQTNGWLSLRVL